MTLRTVIAAGEPKFTWIDVFEPSPEETEEIIRTYGLHPTSVQDCLDPEHLPKYERIGPVTFMIVRAVDEHAPEDADTMQEITRKLAIFSGLDFMVTIHRTDQPFIARLRQEYQGQAGEDHPEVTLVPRLLTDLINGVIDSYGKPLEAAETSLDSFEDTLFGNLEFTGIIRGLHGVKRRLALFKRLLIHTGDVVQRLVPASEPTAPLYQDLRENAQSMSVYADALLDEANNLLGMQLALAAHRTNEVVRVLTVFSVFFLPLTFIVGIYGMNFHFMPELRQRWGYPAVLVLMAGVTLAIYLWFRRRGWLRR